MTRSVTRGRIVVERRDDGFVSVGTTKGDVIASVLYAAEDVPDLIEALLLLDGEPMGPHHDCRESKYWMAMWQEISRRHAGLAVEIAALRPIEIAALEYAAAFRAWNGSTGDEVEANHRRTRTTILGAARDLDRAQRGDLDNRRRSQ